MISLGLGLDHCTIEGRGQHKFCSGRYEFGQIICPLDVLENEGYN